MHSDWAWARVSARLVRRGAGSSDGSPPQGGHDARSQMDAPRTGTLGQTAVGDRVVWGCEPGLSRPGPGQGVCPGRNEGGPEQIPWRERVFARCVRLDHHFTRPGAQSRGHSRRWNMAKKQLRTVKKSDQTGRLNRAEVRSAVISVRDKVAGELKISGASNPARTAVSGKNQHSGAGSTPAAGSKK